MHLTDQKEGGAWMAEAIKRYKERTPASARLFKQACDFLPGGNTRSVMHFNPYPLFLARGEGCYLYDVDANRYLDFVNNYTSLIHGHAHPAIVAAANAQSAQGACFSGPHKSQSDLAELICSRVESVDQVRFCNSGTEATMHAIRAARAFTNKSKIVKIEGGYHGTHDTVEVSVHPEPAKSGPPEAPLSLPENRGISKGVCQDVVVIPFNNQQAAEQIVSAQADEIACLIIEPMLGGAGLIPPEPGYLEFLRDLTRRLGILLVFDEIITFRLGYSGLQGILGIKPDLTAFGKIIGGGYPVGAFGGSKEIMKWYSPLEPGGIAHSGTFNGHPVTMAAGLAAMRHYTQPEIARINALGDRLKAGLKQAMTRQGLKGQATGLGSLVQPHFCKGEIRDYRSASQANKEVMTLVHLELLERGIYIAPRGMCVLSTPMSEKEVDAFIAAFEDSLVAVKPFVENTAPELLA